jgi:hypothetical protein
LTFIDNRNGAVFNGSDLGKEYSGQAVIKRFYVPIAIRRDASEQERQERVARTLESPIQERYDHSQANWMQEIVREVFDLMKAETFYPGPMNPLPKRRKKQKKRKSI